MATFPPVDELLTRAQRITDCEMMALFFSRQLERTTDREKIALFFSRRGMSLTDWEVYTRKYRTYSLSLYRSRLVMLSAEKILKEYPMKLPPEIRDSILAFGRLLGERQNTRTCSLAQEQPSAATGANSTQGNTVMEEEETHWILVPTFGLMMFEIGEENKFDFSQTVYAKEVVMQVAYLDAFVQDTIAVFCRLRSEVTKSAKQPAGFFRARVNWFEQLGLDLTVAETQIKWLEEVENVRHIIVHDGGIVDEEFLRRTGRKDLTVGELFPLSWHYLLRVYCGSKAFAATLFTEVAEKIFHIPIASLRETFMSTMRGWPRAP